MKLFTLILSLLFSSFVFADEDSSITGVYSSLVYHKQSGDIAGQEVTIVMTFEGLRAITYCASGVPVVVPLGKQDDIYFFELGEKEEDSLCGYSKKFIKPTKENLLIWNEGQNPEEATKLPRRASYWVDRNRIE